MIDYTLRFPDQQTADEVLQDYTGSIDIIGLIYKPTGEMLQGEDGPYPAMEPVPGWHVNVRGPESDELAAYAVDVKTPVRVWAQND